MSRLARTFAVIAGALLLAGGGRAQAAGRGAGGLPGGTLSVERGVGGVGVPGQVPGGTLSTVPGVGGLGVPGQVPGGTLSTVPGVGGLGVPGQVPGGILAPAPRFGIRRRLFVQPLVPGIVVPVPGPAPVIVLVPVPQTDNMASSGSEAADVSEATP